jgi:hypothetical protein
MRSLKVTTLESSQYSLWNTFVDRSPQGDVFCYTWWLEAITKSNFKILVILEKDEIVAGIPIAYDDQNRINQPPVTRTLGVLYKHQGNLSEHKQTSDQRRWLNSLLDHLPIENFVQLCMHHNFNDWLPFRWRGFKQTTRYTYLLNYGNKTIDILQKNLQSDKKKKINRAIRSGISVELSDDFELLYHFESLSYQRQGLKFRIPLDDLLLLDNAIKKNGNRKIFKAIDKLNRVHAMLYVAFNKRSAYALLSGSNANLRRMGGHTLVTWEAVKYFQDKVEYYNFGGSDIKLIEEHVRGYGGVMTQYFLIYNEKLFDKRDDIWYHLDMVVFHSKAIFKDLLKRLSRKINK